MADRDYGLIPRWFRAVRAFVAVAECGGFHRAAEQLNLTQSTASQQIKRLEVQIGVSSPLVVSLGQTAVRPPAG